MFFWFLVLCITAVLLFSMYKMSRRNKANANVSSEQIDNQKLIVSTDFKATRAFRIYEIEDEGPYFFIELADSSVLYLNGQYLYEYGWETASFEAFEDEPSHLFPCTDFTLRRPLGKDYSLDIICRGEILIPEVHGIGFARSFNRYTWPYDDADIITDQTYDEIKSLVTGIE